MTSNEFDTDLCTPRDAQESKVYPNLPVLKAQIVRIIHYRMEQTQWQNLISSATTSVSRFGFW